MTTNTVKISRKEYTELKKQAKVDQELLNQLVSSLEDIKAGRIRKVR